MAARPQDAVVFSGMNIAFVELWWEEFQHDLIPYLKISAEH